MNIVSFPDEFGNDPVAVRLRDRIAFLGSHPPPKEERSSDSTRVVFNPPTTKSAEAGLCVMSVGMGSPAQLYHVKKAVPDAGDQRSDVMYISRRWVVGEKKGDIIMGL